MWKAFSLPSWCEYRVYVSLPCRRVLSTQAWYTFIFVLSVSMVFSHTFFVRRAMAVAALPILTLSSASRDKLLEIVEPRWVNLSTTSWEWSPMVIAGVVLTSCPMMLVFFRLMVRANSLHASAKQVISRSRVS